MTEREEIQQAITQFEKQRSSLGDAAVDVALAGLRKRLEELAGGKPPTGPETERPRGERRIVTILFCDVVGSTSLAEKMDPEMWTGLMNATFEHLTAPVDEYEGKVARLMGDAILAFFGAPTAHEDDPQRAILAALKMLENIRPLRERLRREQGLDFNIRVGINTGLAVVGDVGTALHGEYSAMGDAVNLAARMEQTAAAGTVQVGHDTYALVAPLFDFEALGGITIKGKKEPVSAYRVLGRKRQPSGLRGLSGHGINAPLIGRQSEYQLASNIFSRLQEGEGGILAITGEAGIGKSRLVAELRGEFLSERLTWLEGHALSYGKSISYLPFQEILRVSASIDDEDDERQAWLKLEEHIETLFPERIAEILPYLASLLVLEPTEFYLERVKHLDSEALRRQLYRSMRLYVRRLAKVRPLVLVFDDLHWMDGSSVGLVEHLLPLVRDIPLLICGLSRPDPETRAVRLHQIAEEDYAECYTNIALAPLSAGDSGQLVGRLLEIDGLPADVREMMVAKADGNPFYLEEIVRDLIDAGALVQDPLTGRWRATVRIENVTVPDTIQGLLLARIDRLDEELKRVLRRAAVIGRTFLFRVLTAVLRDNRHLPEHVARLQQVELIREKQQTPELEYIFKHALAQEATYDSILLQERREMHERVGLAIETLFKEKIEEFYGLLAYHFSAAERWDRAQEYLLKAGDQAGRMAADSEALGHYERAMMTFRQARGEEWEPLERARLERKIGEALVRLGHYERARSHLERALALLGAPDLPDSRWRTRLAILGAALRQTGHSFLPRLFVRPMGAASEPAVEELFLANRALISIEALLDVGRFLLLSVRGLNAAERAGYALGSARLSSSMAMVFNSIGGRGIAESYLRRGTRYAEKVEPRQPIQVLEQGWVYHYQLAGDPRTALEYAQRSAELAQQAGDLREWSAAMAFAAYAHSNQARLAEAARVSKEAVALADDASDGQAACWCLSALGYTQRRLGKLDEAIESLTRAIALANSLPDYLSQVVAGGWLGRSTIDAGKFDRGLAILETYQEVYEERGAVLGGYVYLGNALADAYLTASEEATGEQKVTWLEKAKRVCRKSLKVAKISRTGMPEAMLFQGRYDWLRGRQGRAQKWWMQGIGVAREIGDPFLEAIIYHEIGRRTGDRGRLLQAESILDELGAAGELKAVRGTLRNFRPVAGE